MKRAVAFINGELKGTPDFYSQYIKEEDFVACADGGANYTYQLGIEPDLIVGDLDSLAASRRRYYEQQGVKFIQHPIQKAKTDGQLLLETLIDQGFSEITVFAALGGRIDHALSNIYLLEELNLTGIELKFVTPQESLELITDQKVITNQQGKTVSLLPITAQVKGVSLTGFKYELKGGTFRRGDTLGMSNVIAEEQAVVEIKTGKLLMIIIEKESQL